MTKNKKQGYCIIKYILIICFDKCSLIFIKGQCPPASTHVSSLIDLSGLFYYASHWRGVFICLCWWACWHLSSSLGRLVWVTVCLWGRRVHALASNEQHPVSNGQFLPCIPSLQGAPGDGIGAIPWCKELNFRGPSPQRQAAAWLLVRAYIEVTWCQLGPDAKPTKVNRKTSTSMYFVSGLYPGRAVFGEM